MAKVSMDFDKTMSKPHVQEYAKQLLDQGHEVWVVTARYDECHIHLYNRTEWTEAGQQDLWDVVDGLGIPRHHVRFMNMEPKYTYLDRTHFVWHLDDDFVEISDAKRYGCSVPFIQVEAGSWKNKCERILKKKTNGK